MLSWSFCVHQKHQKTAGVEQDRVFERIRVSLSIKTPIDRSHINYNILQRINRGPSYTVSRVEVTKGEFFLVNQRVAEVLEQMGRRI